MFHRFDCALGRQYLGPEGSVLKSVHQRWLRSGLEQIYPVFNKMKKYNAIEQINHVCCDPPQLDASLHFWRGAALLQHFLYIYDVLTNQCRITPQTPAHVRKATSLTETSGKFSSIYRFYRKAVSPPRCTSGGGPKGRLTQLLDHHFN